MGTNTLTDVRDSAEVINEFKMTIPKIKETFPESRIYVSSLLPRNDNLHKEAMEINKLLEEYCDETRWVTYLHHTNISKRDLYDRLHLHDGGFYKILWNFKFGMYGLLPKSRGRYR